MQRLMTSSPTMRPSQHRSTELVAAHDLAAPVMQSDEDFQGLRLHPRRLAVDNVLVRLGFEPRSAEQERGLDREIDAPCLQRDQPVHVAPNATANAH